ncbi:MAG: Cytochrome c oxidase assembly protein CtaG [Alphaproteobacteria bacterium MarineAlpha9_Bin4]|nr:cytochrome c oxidase assembly protein [Pelagibacterales bacterium]PPR26185.1 MAG: Cytochrome c oxidase assembly protein CtaG [Alphaproteobacteria bacterium MarineAlpha9_Bin4]|tara:strand:+ start:1362 stop:1919 length:558 start_codon:yes stop_codon:yes gene_type:complete
MKKVKNKKNKSLAILIFVIPSAMFLLSFASVPLYNLFCKVTGYGGTTQESSSPSEIILDQKIKVRFNADRERNLGVYFQPEKRSIITKLGKTNSVEYKVSNKTKKAIQAIASYNVTPQKAGIYFNKLDCFCYEENTILPGETISLPVTFFISPDLYKDPNTKEIKSITLSYTFFNTDNINVRNFK